MPPGASPGTIQRATKPTMSPRTIQARIPTALPSFPNGRIGTQPARGARYRIMKRTFLCLLLAIAVTAAGAPAAETTATEITGIGHGQRLVAARYGDRRCSRRNERRERQRRNLAKQCNLQPDRRRARASRALPAATLRSRTTTSTTIRARAAGRKIPATSVTATRSRATSP